MRDREDDVLKKNYVFAFCSMLENGFSFQGNSIPASNSIEIPFHEVYFDPQVSHDNTSSKEVLLPKNDTYATNNQLIIANNDIRNQIHST